MNNLVVVSVVVPFVLFALCVTASVLLAQRKDAQLGEHAPETLSYKWGYFLGYYGIIWALLIAAAELVSVAAGFYRDWFLLLLAHAVAFGIASYGVLTRRKWGWVFHIPLSLNPGLWAFNSVYLQNRWREFAAR